MREAQVDENTRGYTCPPPVSVAFSKKILGSTLQMSPLP